MTLALLLTAVTGAWAQTETPLTTITPTGKGSYSETTAGVVTVTLSKVSRYNVNYGWLSSASGSVTVEAKEGYTITKCVFKQNSKTPVTITTSPFAITFDDEWGRCVQNDDMDGVTSIEVYGYANAPAEPAIDVTTNAAEEGATFTEASFDMPQYDVTVNYELVRDMSVKMTAEVGDGSDGYRIRIKKDDNNDFVPVNTEEMLISVTDELDDQHPIDLTVNTDFTSLVQKKGEGDTWTDLSNEDKLSVGTFRYKVTGVGNYDGTIYSNEFELYQGYEIKVAAGEYATYYKDEALKVEDENAKLYTITAVSGTTATATELNVAAANTPLLVKNNAAETKTILLIPTTEEANNVTVYSGFKGTLEATQIAGSTDTQANYVCTGKQFTWVKDAGTIAANRCWLELVSSTGAPVLDIVFDGNATGIETTKFTDDANDAWYDLNGRRLQAKPTTKGVYILNGRKVVVK